MTVPAVAFDVGKLRGLGPLKLHPALTPQLLDRVIVILVPETGASHWNPEA